MSEAIKVTGLKEFNKALKQLDAELPKVVRIALNKVSEAVIDKARPDVPVRSGKAARSIRGQSTRTAVRVTAGGSRAPYYAWLDFGGRTGKRKSVRRPFSQYGRYLYPAYFQMRDSGEFVDVMSAALVDVAAQAGLEVT